MALYEDIVLVGAYLDDDNGSDAGAVYVFEYNGTNWVQTDKLLADDGQPGDYFGYSVALSGSTALIGAYLNDDNGSNAGAAYVFEFDGVSWEQEVKLLANDGAVGDRFGISVAYSDNVALVGALEDDTSGINSGSAYVFRRTGVYWVQEAYLVPPGNSAYDKFGRATVVTADTAVFSSRQADTALVFRFDGDNWVEEAQLQPSGSGGRFGCSMSMRDDTLVVGAEQNTNVNGQYAGAAHVFRYLGGTWVEQAKFLASEGAQSDSFGYSVGLSAGTAIIGANGDDDEGFNAGSAYVFHGISDCNDNGTLDICDISDGTSPDADVDGFPDDCEIPGDLNCDSNVDLLDIPPFVQALLDPTGYVVSHTDCHLYNADTNSDGIINGNDVQAFVGLLVP